MPLRLDEDQGRKFTLDTLSVEVLPFTVGGDVLRADSNGPLVI